MAGPGRARPRILPRVTAPASIPTLLGRTTLALVAAAAAATLLTAVLQFAGFRVVDIPGHAPGQIALWRESDRLTLTTDAFYTLDMWGRDCAPKLPFAMYNFDTEQARASLRNLAALEPAAAWPGHAKPVTGDVRGQLEHAADTT